MKKKYKFGEMLLILREEYKDCKRILNQLRKYVSVEGDNNLICFRGSLKMDSESSKDEFTRIFLMVEKRYLDLLKKYQYLKYDWYGRYLYRASFNIEKGDNGIYKLSYDDILTPVDGKKYIPKVEILDQNKFSALIDKLFESDLMRLKYGNFSVNLDNIQLDFDCGSIDSFGSSISWYGVDDTFRYSMPNNKNLSLLEEMLEFEIYAEDISPSWLELLQKHENDFDSNLTFGLDTGIKSKKGILKISDIKDNKVIKLTKKIK